MVILYESIKRLIDIILEYMLYEDEYDRWNRECGIDI